MEGSKEERIRPITNISVKRAVYETTMREFYRRIEAERKEIMLVITIRISTASRMAERTAGMYCRMVSMVMSSLNFYFTAPPRAHSSASRLGNVL